MYELEVIISQVLMLTIYVYISMHVLRGSLSFLTCTIVSILLQCSIVLVVCSVSTLVRYNGPLHPS